MSEICIENKNFSDTISSRYDFYKKNTVFWDQKRGKRSFRLQKGVKKPNKILPSVAKKILSENRCSQLSADIFIAFRTLLEALKSNKYFKMRIFTCFFVL